jgi:hypothetical protein
MTSPLDRISTFFISSSTVRRRPPERLLPQAAAMVNEAFLA